MYKDLLFEALYPLMGAARANSIIDDLNEHQCKWLYLSIVNHQTQEGQV